MGWKLGFDFTAYVAIRLLIGFVQALSLDACERCARLLSFIFWRLLRLRRRVVLENLRIAFPQATEARRREIGYRMWHHLFLMVAEIAHARRKVHDTNWRRHSIVPDVRRVVEILVSRRPVVIISGHFGNFEMGGYLLGLFGFPTYTVARTLDNPFLDRFVNRFRSETGQHMLPKHGSGAEISQLLERGGTLALLGDQSAGKKKACWVRFFGRPASTHKAVAVFSLTNRAPTMVTFVRRLGRPLVYELGIADAVDPAAPDFPWDSVDQMTQWYTDCLERVIRRYPQQYWWLHRRWRIEPPERIARQLSAA